MSVTVRETIVSWKRSNTRFYLYRYFWWVGFPLFWWRNWRYDSSKEVPFKSDEYNYILGFNEEPRVYVSCYYKADFPPTNFLITLENNEPLDRVWCATFPPKRPARPMPKGTVAYA